MLNQYGVIHNNKRSYTESEMREMYEAARENILRNYTFVGFQENGVFDHKKCCKQLGLKYRDHGFMLKSTAKSRQPWDAVTHLLEQINKYDLKLYNVARKKWAN
jgi:hypothetical protein